MSAMALRRLAIALAAVVVVWGLMALTRRLREDRVTRFAFPAIDTGAVDSIALVRAGDSAWLSRAGARWTVNGFAADSTRVRDLLRSLVDTSVWGELVAESPASHASLGVGADSGRRVRVVSHGKLLLEVVTGSRTSDWSGVHVRRASEDAVYALRGGSVSESFSRTRDDWRDHGIARVTPESVSVVELRRGTRSSVLRRTGKVWTLNGAATDSAAVANLLDAWKEPNAMGFASPAQVDSLRLDRPKASAILRGSRGVLVSAVFDSTASGVWARTASGPSVYRLDTWQFGRMLPPDSTLRARKPKP